MHSSSFFVFFSLLASLANAVYLYRGDDRDTRAIDDAGGYRPKGSGRPEGTLFEHVERALKHPDRDPFVSTTIDIEVAKYHARKGCVAIIDSDKIDAPIHNVAAEYAAAGRRYPYASEKEFAVQGDIPKKAIVGVLKKNKDGKWKEVKWPPAKRSIELFEDDVFVE
ncbi:ADP-ribosylation [Xylariaceae sp. FL0662B]|nr:ADP-ribosylation [Xylariaceae sp. FL0662B]